MKFDDCLNYSNSYLKIKTQFKPMIALASAKGITYLGWASLLKESQIKSLSSLSQPEGCDHLDLLRMQLEQYFLGKLKDFDLDLDLRGTEFQKRAWNKLLEIPFGETWYYQQQATALGDANLMRAVGQANGRNPVSIVVPCHRVVAKSGRLQGYAGGLDKKEFLLQHEAQ